MTNLKRLLSQEWALQNPKSASSRKPKFADLSRPANAPTPFRDLSWFEKGLDVLSRSNYASASFAHSTLTGEGNPFAEALRGLKGERRTTYSDVLGAAGMEPGLARGALGFAGDVLLDPITYLTAGAGAGVKVSVGGVVKTLTKAGEAARAAGLVEKTAQAGRVLGKLGEAGGEARKMGLLGRFGLKEIAGRPAESVAKEIGEKASAEALGRAAAGKPVGGAMGKLLAGKAEGEIFKPSALRFAGFPLITGKAAAVPLKAIGRGYLAAEKLPAIGKFLTGAREAGAAVGAGLKKVFSTKSVHPVLDELYTHERDALGFKSQATAELYRKHVVDPIAEAAKRGELTVDGAKKHIRWFMEGLYDIDRGTMAYADKIKALERHFEKFKNLLGEAKQAAIEATQVLKKPGIFTRMEEQSLKRLETSKRILSTKGGKVAGVEATMKEAERKLGGIEGETAAALKPEDVAAEKMRIAKAMAKATKKSPMEFLEQAETEAAEKVFKEKLEAGKMSLLKRMETLSAKAGDLGADYRKTLVSAGAHANLAHPRVLAEMPEAEIVAGLEKKIADTKADLEKSFTKTASIPPHYLTAIDTLEAQLNRAKMQLDKAKSMSETIHPVEVEAARFLKERMKSVFQSEQKLNLPPEFMRDYFPHQIRPEARDFFVKVSHEKDGLKKLMRPEASQRLDAALRRQIEGPVDEITLTKLVDSGVFDPSKVQEYMKEKGLYLTADDLLVFETDPIKAAFNRELKSIRAVNAAELVDQVLETPVFTKARVALGDKETIRLLLEHHPGHALFIRTKDYIEAFRTPAEREAIRQGAEKALVASPFQKIYAPVLETIPPGSPKLGVRAYVIPEEVADHLTKAYSLQFDEKAISDMIRIWDKATSWWKIGATAVRPMFHVRNALSNLWQMMLAGARDPSALVHAGMLQQNAKLAAPVGRWTGEEAMDLANRYGVTRGGFIGADIAEWTERILNPSKNPLSLRGPVARVGTKIGTAIEDNARLALFIDQLKKGADPVAAAMTTKKYLFDYANLTRYEKNIFRRLIPFYSWSSKSIPLALETMLTKPGAVSALAKLREAGEKNVEGSLDRAEVSDFIRENLGVPVRKNAQGKVEYFLLNGWIPTADLSKIDPQELFSMLHPAIKGPIELAMNKSVFTGRPIERFPGELQKFLGVPMPGRVSYVARNIVFLQELDRVLFREDFEPLHAGFMAGGLRTYAQDKAIQMRHHQNELSHQIGDLRNAITLSTQRSGSDSVVVKQAEEHLQVLIDERERVKGRLAEVEAASPKPKPLKPQPGGIMGLLKRKAQ